VVRSVHVHTGCVTLGDCVSLHSTPAPVTPSLPPSLHAVKHCSNSVLLLFVKCLNVCAHVCAGRRYSLCEAHSVMWTMSALDAL